MFYANWFRIDKSNLSFWSCQHSFNTISKRFELSSHYVYLRVIFSLWDLCYLLQLNITLLYFCPLHMDCSIQVYVVVLYELCRLFLFLRITLKSICWVSGFDLPPVHLGIHSTSVFRAQLYLAEKNLKSSSEATSGGTFQDENNILEDVLNGFSSKITLG